MHFTLYFTQDNGPVLVAGPSGLSFQPQILWRFSTFEKNAVISLHSGFVSLEVLAYQGKERFLQLLDPVLAAVETVFKPARVERIGLRYVNRFIGTDLVSIRDFIKPEALGVLVSDMSHNLKHSVSETMVDVDGAGTSILARWGLLDSQLTYDPAAMPPNSEKSWFLDIDAFSIRSEAFKSCMLNDRLNELADVDYRFFRWITTVACSIGY